MTGANSKITNRIMVNITELGISREEALDLLQLVRGNPNSMINSSSSCNTSQPLSNSSIPGSSATQSQHPCNSSQARKVSTALDMLRHEKSMPAIITFCQDLDTMLGGGVPMGKITELCGAPGVGKTQICMQLSVDVQIPQCFGGVAGEAIYVDTEGSFIAHRAADMAKAAVEHCTHMAAQTTEDQDALSYFTLEKILSGIHVFRCHDYIELLALVNLLSEFITEHNKVRLIVIDSIAFHFRHDFDDMSLRTRLLNGIAQNLIRIATQHGLAVVLTNQMTTKVGGHNGQSHLVPALGESWGHASTIRIILFWQNCQRYATLYKSPSKQEMTVPYEVTMSGVRSASQGTDRREDPNNSLSGDHQSGNNPRKRLRTDEIDTS